MKAMVVDVKEESVFSTFKAKLKDGTEVLIKVPKRSLGVQGKAEGIEARQKMGSLFYEGKFSCDSAL